MTFGADWLMSWDVLVLDTDCHTVLGAEGDPKPRESPVVIGSHVWFGARVTVVKGVHLGDDIVIAAGAVVARSEPPGVLIGGVPARILRRDIRWER